jgi:DNA primase
MWRNTFEMEELKRAPEERSARPVVDFDGPTGVSGQGFLERGDDTKRTVDDLGRKSGVDTAGGRATQLSVERRRRPRIVMNDAV